MAAPSEPGREIGGYIPPTFPQNGYDRETPILDSDSDKNPSMEDMLREAQDMQSGSSFNRSRLQLRSDETVSPFQQHISKPSSYSSSTNYSGSYLCINFIIYLHCYIKQWINPS